MVWVNLQKDIKQLNTLIFMMEKNITILPAKILSGLFTQMGSTKLDLLNDSQVLAALILVSLLNDFSLIFYKKTPLPHENTEGVF